MTVKSFYSSNMTQWRDFDPDHHAKGEANQNRRHDAIARRNMEAHLQRASIPVQMTSSMEHLRIPHDTPCRTEMHAPIWLRFPEVVE